MRVADRVALKSLFLAFKEDGSDLLSEDRPHNPSYDRFMTMFEVLTETAVADRELLIKNDAMGDDFNIPRVVDFSFVTNDRSRAIDFIEFVNSKSYGAAQ